MRSSPPSGANLLGTTRAALAAYRVGLASSLAAWPVLLGRAIFYGVCLTVLTAFWDKVGAARLAGTLATRLPPGGLGVYIGVTEWITLSVTPIQLRLEDDIRSGALEPHLLRPKPYLAQTIATEAGNMTARLGMIALGALLILTVSGRVWPSPLALAFVGVLGVIGGFIGILLYCLVGLSAFWLRKVLPPLLIMQKLMFLLGGLFAPISLYPPALRALAEASPFAAHLGFAGLQIIAPSASAFCFALALQAFWILALSGLIALAWRAGLKRTLQGVV
ncbi:MAG TPA: ABC-2 family transporter protein [Caulobacteraceae bacterium]|jgi:ABC-2 type transport system permease protein